ncbi:MAG: aminotransferase class III-fold pyridoxal phosphate-dependent enzyme, partial [Spirulina sp. SIO3F2]|nr:aminotransferase class III-fold pyridoxal phosphate-dependent enzyme [Spirulina sp. SIO3F2]
MYQAGTLSGNPLAMTAGIQTLKLLQKAGAYEQLERITKKLVDGLQAVAQETGNAAYGGNISGMFGLFFQANAVHNYDQAKASDLEKFSRYHRGMLEQGIYLAPSQFEAGFTSLAHTDEDIEQTIAAARTVMASLNQ